MKDFARDVFQMFVYLIGGLLLGVLSFIILQYPVKIGFEGIRVNLGGSEKALSSCILVFAQEIAGFIAIWSLVRRTGYKENAPDAGVWNLHVLVTAACACGIYVLMILLTNFSWTVFYQDTMHWMDFLYGHRELGGIGIAGMRGDYRPQSILILTIHGLIYMLPMNLGYISGAKKRIADRAKLTHKEG